MRTKCRKKKLDEKRESALSPFVSLYLIVMYLLTDLWHLPQTEHPRGPLGNPRARSIEVFLIVSQSVSQSHDGEGFS